MATSPTTSNPLRHDQLGGPTENLTQVQLRRLEVEGLFGTFTHDVLFPGSSDDVGANSVVILHGPNGIGKTTVLSMLEGLLRLDFTPFRSVPFVRCKLVFSNGSSVDVEPSDPTPPHRLTVKFHDTTVSLHSDHGGPSENSQEAVQAVEQFRAEFVRFTRGIEFTLIDSTRLLKRLVPQDASAEHYLTTIVEDDGVLRPARRLRKGARRRPEGPYLAGRVKQFISAAQADYKSFFSSRSPALFPKLVRAISQPSLIPPEVPHLMQRFAKIREQDAEISAFGLSVDDWDFEWI